MPDNSRTSNLELQTSNLFARTDAIHFGATFGAGALKHLPAVFRRDFFRVFHLSFGFALHAIGFHVSVSLDGFDAAGNAPSLQRPAPFACVQ
jgi:hypothetical protein